MSVIPYIDDLPVVPSIPMMPLIRRVSYRGAYDDLNLSYMLYVVSGMYVLVGLVTFFTYGVQLYSPPLTSNLDDSFSSTRKLPTSTATEFESVA